MLRTGAERRTRRTGRRRRPRRRRGRGRGPRRVDRPGPAEPCPGQHILVPLGAVVGHHPCARPQLRSEVAAHERVDLVPREGRRTGWRLGCRTRGVVTHVHERTARDERVVDRLGHLGPAGAVERLAEADDAERRQSQGRQLFGRGAEHLGGDPGAPQVRLGLGRHLRVGLEDGDVLEQRTEAEGHGAGAAADVEEVPGAVEPQLPLHDLRQVGGVGRPPAEVVRCRPAELGRVVVHDPTLARGGRTVPQVGVEPTTFRLGGGCSIH